MKRVRFLITGIVVILVFGSCEKAFLSENPSTDNLAIFDEYWSIMNEKYAMFESKGIDWELVRDTIRPLIITELTEQELFDILGSMTIAVRDGHTCLIAPFDEVTYDLEKGYPLDFDIEMLINTIGGGLTVLEDSAMLYKILDSNIGYIHIPSFDVNIDEEEIDEILKGFENTNGLLIDVRMNGGGDPALATRLASHLVSTQKYAGYEKFKIGPAPNDFAKSEIYLSPSDGYLYTKPIAILTNRYCYSATTTFIYLLDSYDHIITIGGRTGGGSGGVTDGYLANGWIYNLSSSEFIDAKGRYLDNGVEPDIIVHLDTLDFLKDEIVERAIIELN